MAENQGIAPPNFGTPVGQVRLLVGDTNPTPHLENDQPITGQGDYLWYSDSELTALLTMNGGSVKLTAAHVIESIAMSQALLLKKFTSADLSVDGPAISDALLKRAKLLRDQADDDLALVVRDYVKLVNTGRPTPDWYGWPELPNRYGGGYPADVAYQVM